MIKIIQGLCCTLFLSIVSLNVSLAQPAVTAPTVTAPVSSTNTNGASNAKADDIRRYIIIHNDISNLTIYPVVQIPQAGNCVSGSTQVDRIKVTNGVAPNETIKIYLPDKCWYRAGRVYLFSVNAGSFETVIDKDQKASYSDAPVCFQLNKDGTDGPAVSCEKGTANASYPLDSPAQLAEYTFDADDPKTGNPSPDPDKGRLMTDIDLSYVDQVYLPVAIAIDDGGTSGYMGTIMKFDPFNTQVTNFIAQAKWMPYAAYVQNNWQRNKFNDFGTPSLPRTYHIPAAYNLFALSRSLATSMLYTTTGSVPYMVDQTKVVNPDEKTVDQIGTNPTMDELIDRWMVWVNAPSSSNSNSKQEDPCEVTGDISDKFLSTPPVIDKQGFCRQFKATVQKVWNEYLANIGCPISPSNPHCACPKREKDPACIIQNILGYTYGPDSGWLPESVQAILRGVPYNETGNLYQYDKWILFWAPYDGNDNPYSLNPFSHFIHSPDGINAVAYSFSIDDKYGNFRDEGKGFIINVGGDTQLVNKEPFDPYQQYKVNWGPGWDHAEVCGRKVAINQLPGNARIFFPKQNDQDNYCDIKIFPTASEDSFLAMRLKLITQSVKDNYTGLSHNVDSLQFVPDFCAKNSSADLAKTCDHINLSAIITKSPNKPSDIEYVSVDPDKRPLIYLNLPPPPALPSCTPPCKLGETCNPETNKCEVCTPACKSPLLCNPNNKQCEICSPPCQEGQTCNAQSKQCEASVCPPCKPDEQCNPETKQCEPKSPCPPCGPDEICNKDTKKCEKKADQCTPACTENQVCYKGQCYTSAGSTKKIELHIVPPYVIKCDDPNAETQPYGYICNMTSYVSTTGETLDQLTLKPWDKCPTAKLTFVNGQLVKETGQDVNQNNSAYSVTIGYCQQP